MNTTNTNTQTTEEWTDERKQAFDKASGYESPSTTIITSSPSVEIGRAHV